MTDFFFRTEDIKGDEVLDYFVESSTDRQIVDSLKNRNPTILLGSRGVGKSFLMKVAQAELLRDFERDRVFPIYVSFTKSSLVLSGGDERFHFWMLARICSSILRGFAKQGLLAASPLSIKVLAGSDVRQDAPDTLIEKVAEEFENGWKQPDQAIDVTSLPDVDVLKEAIEDTCSALSIDRIALFIDEAAHIFLPTQQRQFFTLFRDLRSAYLTCNAAVYPGVTSFGSTFQPVHDASIISVDRDVTDSAYVNHMREIVVKQAESRMIQNIETHGENFAVLAYASTGNPRSLLKTVARAHDISTAKTNEVIRDYYRNDVWAEHSLLSGRYAGYRPLIDWGRSFLENTVLPELKKKNDQYLSTDKKTSCFFWVHRDAPETVRQALRILSYTGIVTEHFQGVKATRSEIGTRYLVNLGCLFTLEGSAPAAAAFRIATNITVKRMTEYGVNHSVFSKLEGVHANLDDEQVGNAALKEQLGRDIEVLDITDWQRAKLRELNLNTVKEVLGATEVQLKKAHYVGDVRSRRMRNAAIAAVYEFLSG